MYLAFYRGTGIFSGLVRWWTRSPYAHVELGFSPELHFRCIPGRKSGWVANPDIPTCIVSLDLTEEQIVRIKQFCDDEVGCAYDWRGIFLAQVLNLSRSDPKKWFCSEHCVAALQLVGVIARWIKPSTMCPGLLYCERTEK